MPDWGFDVGDTVKIADDGVVSEFAGCFGVIESFFNDGKSVYVNVETMAGVKRGDCSYDYRHLITPVHKVHPITEADLMEVLNG